MIVGTAKVLWEAGGPVERVEAVANMLTSGGKVVASGCAWTSAVSGPRARRPYAVNSARNVYLGHPEVDS